MKQGNPRVLCSIGAMSACEMYRIITPYAYLKKEGYNVNWVYQEELAYVKDEYDVYVFPRVAALEIGTALEFITSAHLENKAIVFEMDDDLLHIPPWNPNQPSEELTMGLLEMVKYSDMITVSTPYLANSIKHLNDHVKVLPNYVDPDLWKFPNGKDAVRTVKGLTVGIQGGASHLYDWEILAEVLPAVATRVPVNFVVAGYFPPYILELKSLLGDRLTLLNWVPVQYYPAIVAQIDIGLCPLKDDEFSRSKSFIKAMEFSMIGAPVIASPTVYDQLILHGQDGFIAQDYTQWVNYICKLASNKKLRKQMGEALRGKVLRYYNIQNEAWRWMDAYREAWQLVSH